jgi:hypothetical protein
VPAAWIGCRSKGVCLHLLLPLPSTEPDVQCLVPSTRLWREWLQLRRATVGWCPNSSCIDATAVLLSCCHVCGSACCVRTALSLCLVTGCGSAQHALTPESTVQDGQQAQCEY